MVVVLRCIVRKRAYRTRLWRLSVAFLGFLCRFACQLYEKDEMGTIDWRLRVVSLEGRISRT
jgi:hypothetical protein